MKAGSEARTRVLCLGSRRSTTELYPQLCVIIGFREGAVKNPFTGTLLNVRVLSGLGTLLRPLQV